MEKLNNKKHTEEEIRIIEYATKKLLEKDTAADLVKELKKCNTQNEFEAFILRKTGYDESADIENFYDSERSPLYETLEDYIILRDMSRMKHLLHANLLLEKNKKDK